MKQTKTKKIVGITFGSFDLTHAGHYLMFREAKEHCDYLIVGLHLDPSVERKNKNKPIQTLREREIQLRACKYIDKIVLYKTEADLVKILEKIKPDVRIIGEDWKGRNYTGKGLPIKMVFNSRKHNYSTTNLRTRIINAYLKTSKIKS